MLGPFPTAVCESFALWAKASGAEWVGRLVIPTDCRKRLTCRPPTICVSVRVLVCSATVWSCLPAVQRCSRWTLYCYGLFWLKKRPPKSSKKILFAKWAGKSLDFRASSFLSLLAENPKYGLFKEYYCGAVSHLMANNGSDRNSCTIVYPILGTSFRVRFLCQKGCEQWNRLKSRVRLILLVSCPTPLGQRVAESKLMTKVDTLGIQTWSVLVP